MTWLITRNSNFEKAVVSVKPVSDSQNPHERFKNRVKRLVMIKNVSLYCHWASHAWSSTISSSVQHLKSMGIMLSHMKPGLAVTMNRACSHLFFEVQTLENFWNELIFLLANFGFYLCLLPYWMVINASENGDIILGTFGVMFTNANVNDEKGSSAWNA